MKQLEDHTRKKSKHSKSTEGQDIRMKRLLFNAQVTAILSALEAVGFILVVMIGSVLDSRKFAFFSIRIVENIVLPCLYLMNTSENRDKIFQIGWRRFLLEYVRLFGVIQFFATMSKISLPWKRSNAVASVELEAFSSEENRCVISHISKKDDEESYVESGNVYLYHCSLNVPCTENPRIPYTILTSCNKNSPVRTIRNDASTSSDAKMKASKLEIVESRLSILNELQGCVENEMDYLRLFTKFTYLEASEYKDDGLYSNAEIEDDLIIQRMIKVSTNDCDRKRINMRLVKINELRNSLFEEDSYQNAMNDFIDLEEQLLDDSKNEISTISNVVLY